MPQEERNITMKVSLTEKRFLDYCRRIGFAAGQLYIMDGLPKKIENPVRSMRFDIAREKMEPVKEMPLTDNRG